MRSLRPTLAWLLALAACDAALAGATIEPELGAALTTMGEGERVEVIAYFSDRVPLDPDKGGGGPAARSELVRALKEKARTLQAPLRERLSARAIDSRSLWLINGLALEADAATVRRLAEWPGVERIALDREIRAPQLSDRADSVQATPEWNVAMIRADELWSQGYTGSGIVVALMDSGVDAVHQDLAGRRRASHSWYDPNGQHATPDDQTGHGTQVLGLIVGGSAGGTAIGVAPDARWIAVKIFDDPHSGCPDGCASYSAIHLGFQWLLDPDGDPGTDDGPHVVNNSWGLRDDVGQCVLEFELDVETLRAAGIAVVFSAGNEGPAAGTSLSPANYRGALGVGAVDSGYGLGGFSSRGPSPCDGSVFPGVVAPGVNVWTADLTFGGVIPDSYTYVSGTSFASPHVTGALALLRQAVPGATVEQLEWALTDASYDLGSAGADNDYGAGLIDAVAALDQLQTPQCTDADGDLVYAESGCGTPPDCDDADGQLWSRPGEVGTLGFAADGQTLGWAPPAQTGGVAPALRYDTLRSPDAADFVADVTCIETDDAADTSAVDSESPGPGTSFFYLVRAENGCPGAWGTLGDRSDQIERTGGGCP